MNLSDQSITNTNQCTPPTILTYSHVSDFFDFGPDPDDCLDPVLDLDTSVATELVQFVKQNCIKTIRSNSFNNNDTCKCNRKLLILINCLTCSDEYFRTKTALENYMQFVEPVSLLCGHKWVNNKNPDLVAKVRRIFYD